MASGSRTSRPCRPMMERRPPMLKDFLVGDVDAINPCSSSSAGFKSFPGRLQRSRSRSRAVADATISALQKLLNAVKFLPSLPSAVKSRKGNAEAVARARVKDILRWKSFTREVMIDGQDYAGAAVGGESRGNVVVGREDPMWRGAGRVLYSDMGPTKKEDEEEQKSPVSVLDSPFTSHNQDSSSFDQSLANVEEKRERLMERIKWFETLAGVDPCIDFNDHFIIPMEDDTNHLEEELDQVEETPKDDYTQVEYDHPKAYPTSCIGDMEKEATWSKFNEQSTQMGLELEMGMLNALLDELLFELFVGSDLV